MLKRIAPKMTLVHFIVNLLNSFLEEEPYLSHL